MGVVAVTLLDAEGRGPELLEDLLCALKGDGMFQLPQLHGAGDGGIAAVHEHLFAALLAGGGTVAEELGMDLALGQPGALDELLIEFAHCVVALEHGEQRGDKVAEGRGHDP